MQVQHKMVNTSFANQEKEKTRNKMEKITQDKETLSIAKGHKTPFVSLLFQEKIPT